MKKTKLLKALSLIVAMFLLVSFAGCSQEKSDSSKEKSASISSSGKQPTNADISTVSENDSESSSISNLQSNSINDNESSNEITCEGPPRIFHTYYGETIDKFIEWCKDVKVNGDPYGEYNQSSKVVEYLKDSQSIIIPFMKKDSYAFKYASTYLDSDDGGFGYYINFRTEEGSEFQIGILPIEEKTSSSKKKQILQTFVNISFWKTKNLKNGSPWGEYYATTNDGDVGAVFIVSDYIVNVSVSEPKTTLTEWNPEYFDYFDFETVSLK